MVAEGDTSLVPVTSLEGRDRPAMKSGEPLLLARLRRATFIAALAVSWASGSVSAQYACEQWAPLATFGNPPARFGQQMVYDSDRQKIIMFGGETRDALTLPVYLNDTWEFDLGTETWTEIDAGEDVPDGRSGFSMAYDQVTKRVLLWGGLRIDLPGPTDDVARDVWSYDPVAHVWQFREVIPLYIGTIQAAMAYDPIREEAVVFGGRDDDQAYDLTFTGAGVFTQKNPAHHPDARIGHTMVWSPSLGGIVLYGGESFGDSGFGTQYADVWLWDGTDWQYLGTGIALTDQGAVWDTLFGKLILFGGSPETANVYFRGSDGVTMVHPTMGGPEARGRMGFVWDEAQNLAVMFGGKAGDNIYDGTWAFGGRPPTIESEPLGRESPPCQDNFFTYTPGGIGPLATQWQRIVDGTPIDLHDNARMFGTTTQQLEINPVRPDDSGLYRVEVANDCGTTPSLPFSITVEEGAWIQTTLGPKRENTQMAYDSGRGKVVLFGGFQAPGEDGFDYVTENDTWEYDGSTWTRVVDTSVLPGAIPGRQTASMAYDPVRGVTVMFGGFYADNTHQNDGTLSDTWEWNGSTWTQKANGPGPRIKGQMVWDPDRQRILLYGGRVGGSAQANDLWEWDGTTWTQRSPSGDLPPGNELATAAYDPGRKALVVQTATTTNPPVGQTWELIDDHWTLVGTTAENAFTNGTFVMQYDTAREHVVGIGLHLVTGDPREHETWLQTTPGTWRRMNVAQLLPARTYFPTAYDSGRSRMVIQGGHDLTNGEELLETRELTFEGDPLCGVTVCGDGAVDPGEDCDPFTDDDGACCYHCHFASEFTPCGIDGRCDDAGHCVVTSCGNGVVDNGEQCDPYAAPYDPFVDACCSFDCTFSAAGTDCYQPTDTGVCNASGECVSSQCGDGIINSDLEQCDGPDVECCTPTCRITSHAACGDPCDGSQCADLGANGIDCLGLDDPTGCSAATSVIGYLGPEGGTLSTPDGSASLILGPGVGPAGTYSIGSQLASSEFSLGDASILVLAARFQPSTTFGAPGATIVLRWLDADNDGLVDGNGAEERSLTLFHDGVVSGQCSTDPGCDRGANTWPFSTTSFSEFAVAGTPPPDCTLFGKPRLVLGKTRLPTGDDTLAFSGTLPAPAAAPDPDLAGLGFRLDDAQGTVVDLAIPPGSFDKATKTGWKVGKKRTKWIWTHPKRGAPSGIVKVMVAVRAKKALLIVKVKGTAGAFAVTTPVAVALTFPDGGDCGLTRFDGAGQSCVIKRKGKSLVCK
jgi:hypothetical protein